MPPPKWRRLRWRGFFFVISGYLITGLLLREIETDQRIDVTAFWARRARRLLPNAAGQVLRRMFRMTGLKPSIDRGGPRAYDLRHTFAVHRLTRWYRARVDLHARLPWLSAYMGHLDLLGTETYLTATPELLALVARRFHHRFVGDRRQ